MTTLEAILFLIVAAGTPILLAAIGELVAQRAGVVNLGVEGMMAMGAASAAAGAALLGSTLAGVALGMLAGAALALLFAVAALGFAANGIGVGIAVALVGLGLSSAVGAPFVGATGAAIGPTPLPVLSDLPLVGAPLFSQDVLVYVAAVLAIGVAPFLRRSRAGLVLRCVGEDQTSARALGLPVLRARVCAVLFGGLCAGLAGAHLALVDPGGWTPGATEGRGFVAVALVALAAWRPGLAALGALALGATFALGDHAGEIGPPAQALAAAPFVATLIALALVGAKRGGAPAAPGSLGAPPVPDR